MLDESGTTTTSYGDAPCVSMTILNKKNVWVNRKQTPHEVWYGKPPTVKYFRIFWKQMFSQKD